MKIETVKVSVLKVIPEQVYEAAGRTVDVYWHVLAEVVTSDGVKGFGYTVAPGASMVPVIAHASRELHVHLAPAFANGYLIENVPRSAGILKAMPAVEKGCLVAPKLPGLGLELNEDAVRRFTYTS